MAEAEFPVCVFCGSRFGADPAFADLARLVGHGLAARSMPLVYGGGDVGLMGTVADAVMDQGGKVYGFIPERLMNLEVGKGNITELKITRDMFDRKSLMIEQSAAFVALPGGLGTLDEILDAITLKQLGYHAKPVLLIGGEPFWAPFAHLIEHVIAQEFAGKSAAHLFEIVADHTALFERLDAARC